MRGTDLAPLLQETASLLDMGFSVQEAGSRLLAVSPAAVRPVLEHVFAEVQKGSTLRHALALTPGLPPLLAAACSQGTAEFSPPQLERLAELMLDAEDRSVAVRAGLMYPRILLAGSLILTWLVAGVAHAIRNWYGDGIYTVPLMARLLLNLSASWLIPIGTSVVLALGLFLISDRAETLRNRLPLVGTWLRRHRLVGWLRGTAYMLDDGCSLEAALRAAAIDDEFRRVAERCAAGEPLEAAVKLPATCHVLLRHDGASAAALERAADILDRELQAQTERGISLMEPLAMICLAPLLGMIVFSVILPLYAFGGALH